MKRHRWIRRLGTLLLLCIVCAAVMTILVFEGRSRGIVGDKGEETIVGWMIDKIVSGEIDLSDEDGIRSAVSEGEAQLGITLTQQDRDRITAFARKLDSIETGAEGFMDQAWQMYHKYSEEIVEEANATINKAVEGAVESAAENFFESITQSIKGFFRNLTVS